MKIPLLRPNPPRLSQLGEDLQAIEASGIFSNYGPVNTRLESALVEKLFGGRGSCLTVGNATIGLMLAIRQAVTENLGERRYALMPSFTFSATAQAALWAGLTPLFCDVDEETWMLSHEHVQNLIESYRDKIAVIIPYATFGNCLDIQYYEELSAREGIPVMIDAAASLGSRTIKGEGFAAGSQIPVVFSMHATKTFAVAEAGLIYSTNGDLTGELRAMANFGFETPRISTKIGLNGKLSEVIALMALKKLEGFEGVVAHRELLADGYRRMLPEMQSQRMTGSRHAYQFMSLLLPESHSARRKEFLQLLTKKEIGWATYGSPHLAEHPFFKERCPTGPLETTNKIARRIVSLPMSDQMSMDELETVGERVRVSLVESLDTH